MHFSVAVKRFDIKMHSGSIPMNLGGSGLLIDLAKDHLSVVCQNFETACSLKLLGQFQSNFICSLQANGKESLYT